MRIIFKSAFKQLPLQKIIDDFNERIIPHLTTVENQKQEIEALQKELNRSHQEKDIMQADIVRLQNALSESEANAQAIRLTELAWQRRAEELDQENKGFKNMLERHAKTVSLPLSLFVSNLFM